MMLPTKKTIKTANKNVSRAKKALLAIALTFNPMLIDTSEAVEVISASDRAMGGDVFRTASSRQPSTDETTAMVPSPDSFILGSRSFSIPFTVDQSEHGSLEVHLFAAEANGPATEWKWIEAKRSGGAANQEFEFTAGEDGEFWFATWTTQATKRTTSPKPAVGDIQPQRKIYVDTTKPAIEISAESDGDGKVRLVASVWDATPLGDVVVRYVTDQMKDWQVLNSNGLGKSKTVDFQPIGVWEQLSIQIVATDTAGNQAVANEIVRRPRIAADATPPGPRYADSTLTPWSNQTWAGQSVPYRRQFATSATTSGGDLSARKPEEILPPPATPEQIGNSFGLTPPDQTPQERTTPETAPLALKKAPETIPAPAPALAPAPAPALAPKADPKTKLKKYRSRSLKEAMRPLSEQSRVPEKSIESETRSARSLSRRPSVPMTSRVPVRYSDSERFSLDYILEAVDAQGVEAVELYGSVDEGATWKLWGRDPDRQSPFDIETREEGVFGYRIVVVGRSGLASARPLAGDLPDMVVVVDKQSPEVRISGARYGEGDRIGALVIRYDCIDGNLMERPITLAFSENVDGPWTTIAGGLRNDGDYVWPADPGLPRSFYLRLDAKDKAGNVGTYILDKAIDAQGLAPRARIRGFQTISGS